MEVSSWQNNSCKWINVHCRVWLEGNPNMLISSSHLSCSHRSNVASPMIDACISNMFHIFLAQCLVQTLVYSETGSSCWRFFGFFTQCLQVTLHIRKSCKSVIHWYQQHPSTIPTACGRSRSAGEWLSRLANGANAYGSWIFHGEVWPLLLSCMLEI